MKSFVIVAGVVLSILTVFAAYLHGKGTDGQSSNYSFDKFARAFTAGCERRQENLVKSEDFKYIFGTTHPLG